LISGGTSQVIGQVMSFITMQGYFYATLVLTCPWMMLVNPSASQIISITGRRGGEGGDKEEGGEGGGGESPSSWKGSRYQRNSAASLGTMADS
jgi:hypothetical protein